MNPNNMAFKEWAVICDALGDGRQSLILRKGGIAEGREGFRFAHEEFYLFPTRFHEQVAHTRLPSDTPIPPESAEHSIQYLVKVEFAGLVSDWNTVCALEPYHLWTRETIRARFEYDTPQGLSAALTRVFRLETPITFPDAPAYGGCRSWVKIPVETSGVLTPVLDDSTHAERASAIRKILGV